MIIIKKFVDARELLANNITYFRLQKGWSQEDLAYALGTTARYVSSLENSKRNTRIDYISHIAWTLDVSIEQLFEERDLVKNHRRPRKQR